MNGKLNAHFSILITNECKACIFSPMLKCVVKIPLNLGIILCGSVPAEITEAVIYLRVTLLCHGVCIQDLVVRLWCHSHSLLGQCYSEWRCSMFHGTVLMALPDGGLLPCVRSLPFDLLPPDPPVTGFCSSLPNRFWCGISVEGAPQDQAPSAHHKPSLPRIHNVGPDLHHSQSVHRTSDDDTFQILRQCLYNWRTCCKRYFFLLFLIHCSSMLNPISRLINVTLPLPPKMFDFLSLSFSKFTLICIINCYWLILGTLIMSIKLNS